jgi:thermopsin
MARSGVLGTVINPKSGYSSEPAPMGIADFGVTGSGPGASAYQYSASSFVGTAQINSMSMTLNGQTSPTTVAFELNAVLVLQRNGASYTYWIQNGLHVATSSRYFTIGGAYVWNFSSPTASYAAGELKGNKSSTQSGNLYVFIPGCGVFTGQCSTLSWPTTVQGRVAAVSLGGVPELDFQYDLGGGWVTYDSVSFPHLSGATVEGFIVNGHNPTPYNARLFYDAEWVWVAAGGGSSGRDQGSDLSMSLEYWNGHNYQEVPAAWDFGSNTGETSLNVSESLSTASTDGAVSAHVSSGSGTLGVLYNASSVGFLNATFPVGNGTATVQGTAHPFQGAGANLTLAPGTYVVSLQNYSNATHLAAIVGGQIDHVDFSGAGRTTFEESGLPAGTTWGLNVSGRLAPGNGTSLSLSLPNGTYGIEYIPVPGYFWNASTPSTIHVPLADTLVVRFQPFTYAVSISETGLPPGTPWWVSSVASGSGVSSVYRADSGSPVVLPAPNGSTNYTPGAAYEFEAVPTTGAIVIIGGHVNPIEVQFSYRPTFIVGTVDPANATVTIGGVAQSVTSGTFNDSVIPGNYTLVASATGYDTESVMVTATAGNTTVEPVTLVINLSGIPHSTPPAASSSLGLLPWIGLGAAAVAVAISLILLRRRAGRT